MPSFRFALKVSLANVVVMLGACLSLASDAQERTDKAVVTRQKLFSIPFYLNNRVSAPKEVRLYVSGDRGKRWSLYQKRTSRDQKFDFHAGRDGEYWFVVGSDRYANKPDESTVPEKIVRIDSANPVVDLQVEAIDQRRLSAKWKASDPNLDGKSLRLSYQTSPESDWIDVDTISPAESESAVEGEISWNIAADARAVRVRAKVVDRAGNEGSIMRTAALSNFAKSAIDVRMNSQATPARTASQPLGRSSPNDQRPIGVSDYARTDSPAAETGASADWPASDLRDRAPRSTESANEPFDSRDERQAESRGPLEDSDRFDRRDDVASDPNRGANDLSPKRPQGFVAGSERDRPALPDARDNRFSPLPWETPKNPGASGVPSTTPGLESRTADYRDQDLRSQDSVTRQPRRESFSSEDRPTNRSDGFEDHRDATLAGQSSAEQVADLEQQRDFLTNEYGEVDRTPDNRKQLDRGEFDRGEFDSDRETALPSLPSLPDDHFASETGDSTQPSTHQSNRHDDEKSAADFRRGDRQAVPSSDRFEEQPNQRVDSPALPDAATPPVSVVDHYTKSKQFNLDYDVTNVSAGVARVELWATVDNGRTWEPYGLDEDQTSPFLVELETEGRFGFQLLLHGRDGRSARPPQSGDPADMVIEVDTTRPVAFLTSATYDVVARLLEVEWRAQDKNLVDSPVTLSYAETLNGPWVIVARDIRNSGRYQWRPDSKLPRSMYVQVDVSDRAGNRTVHQFPKPVSTVAEPPRGRIRAVRPK